VKIAVASQKSETGLLLALNLGQLWPNGVHSSVTINPSSHWPGCTQVEKQQNTYNIEKSTFIQATYTPCLGNVVPTLQNLQKYLQQYNS
jgi:hypothetical protein